MFKFRRQLAFLAIPAALAVGAVSYGSVIAAASPFSSAPIATESGTESAESNVEATSIDADNVQFESQSESQSDTQVDGATNQ